MGRIDVLVGSALGLLFRKGKAGVPNPGDDEGTGSESTIAGDISSGSDADREPSEVLGIDVMKRGCRGKEKEKKDPPMNTKSTKYIISAASTGYSC